MEGNKMKMREALEQALYFLRRHHMGAVYAPDGETLISCEEVAKIVDEALSAPARNCDVGAAEEQEKRFYEKFCVKSCFTCPLSGLKRSRKADCIMTWAQMPYDAQEGDGK